MTHPDFTAAHRIAHDDQGAQGITATDNGIDDDATGKSFLSENRDLPRKARASLSHITAGLTTVK